MGLHPMSLPEFVERYCQNTLDEIRSLALRNAVVHHCVQMIDRGEYSQEAGLIMAVKLLADQNEELIKSVAQQPQLYVIETAKARLQIPTNYHCTDLEIFNSP